MTTTLKVNNKIFNSIVKAAKFIGCPAYRISNTLYAKKNEINGFTIEKVEKKAKRKRRSFISKRSVQVKCLDDNTIYNSIAQAAKQDKVESIANQNAIVTLHGKKIRSFNNIKKKINSIKLEDVYKYAKHLLNNKYSITIVHSK